MSECFSCPLLLLFHHYTCSTQNRGVMNGPISYIRGCSTERSHNDRAARREEKVWTDIYLLLPVSSQCLRAILCDPMGILLCPWRLSRQEYWSGLPCLPPGDHPNPGIKPRFPTFQADSLPSEPPGKPIAGWNLYQTDCCCCCCCC